LNDLNSSAKKARFDEMENPEGLTTDSTTSSFEAQTAAKKKAAIRTIGTITPVEDFKILIEQGSPSFTDVCKQMSTIILELINNSRGDSLFEKALQCLQTLREICIQKLEPKIFNDLQNLIKKQATNIDGRKDFWKKIVDGR
jgi:ATP-dependent DNA helicase 2 subunit 2